MRNSYAIFLAFFVLIGALASTGCDAEEYKAAGKGDVSEQVEMIDKATMDQLAAQMEPSQPHHLLSELAGAWDYELLYRAKRDAKPQVSTGRVEYELVLGDKFLFGENLAHLNIGGESIPYKSWTILGYDTHKNAYTSVLLDAMRSDISTGTGQYNEKLDVLEETGSFTHPLTGEEKAYRSELKFSGGGTHTQSIFIDDGAGEEFKVLEIEFRRPS